jgi:hypothetical protein
MRSRGTALLVAGLVLLAGIAVADALRGRYGGDDAATRPEPTVREPTATAAEPDPRAELADADVAGVLYATVAEDAGCAFQAIRLPDLSTAHLFRAPACRFDVSPDGRRIAFGSPCPAERTFVFELESDVSFAHAGCSPAWRPDGRLTYVRQGDVVAVATPGCSDRRCGTTLVSARQLASALDRRFDDDFATRFALREIGWFTRRRLVAVVAARPSQQELEQDLEQGFAFVLEEGRLTAEPVVARSFVQLHVLPRRRHAAVSSRSGIEIIGPDANVYGETLPPGGARALAYAPDENAHAVAASSDVCFYRASGETIACVPLNAADLEWR